MNNKKKTCEIIVGILKNIYPDAKCSLDYANDPWKLLIMAILSAQCTDARVNIVCRELFKKYPDAKSLSGADITDVENIIRPCGMTKNKSKNIVLSSKRLMKKYNGDLPDNMDELLEFEGVGRKIANLLLGDLFDKPAIVADTHCIRICGRLGMYKEDLKNPLKTELIMSKLIEPKEQADFCHRLVMFGRETCTAKNPRCENCPLSSYCKHFLNNQSSPV